MLTGLQKGVLLVGCKLVFIDDKPVLALAWEGVQAGSVVCNILQNVKLASQIPRHDKAQHREMVYWFGGRVPSEDVVRSSGSKMIRPRPAYHLVFLSATATAVTVTGPSASLGSWLSVAIEHGFAIGALTRIPKNISEAYIVAIFVKVGQYNNLFLFIIILTH